MFQKVSFYDGKDIKKWQTFLKELSEKGTTGILLFVAEETPFDYNLIQPIFKKMKIGVIGCIFPEVIYNGSCFKKGIVGCAFSSHIKIKVIKNLKTFKGNFPKNFISKNTESLLIFNDGWANNIPFLIESLYELNDKAMSFIGGGVGSITDVNRSSLFTSEEYFSRGAIIIAVNDYLSVRINHGLQPIFEPFIATEVDKHILKSINWEPAFQYYKTLIEKAGNIKLTKDNFLEVTKTYPLGILKYDNEIVPRCPINIINKNSILMGSEIPPNSIMSIMKGDPDKFIEASGEATDKAKIDFEIKKKKSPTKALLIECITRTMFLENRFNEQVNLIKTKAGKKVMLFGFLSLGEIGSTGNKFIELYNKTFVVGMGV